jgi:hypothetical protein
MVIWEVVAQRIGKQDQERGRCIRANEGKGREVGEKTQR